MSRNNAKKHKEAKRTSRNKGKLRTEQQTERRTRLLKERSTTLKTDLHFLLHKVYHDDGRFITPFLKSRRGPGPEEIKKGCHRLAKVVHPDKDLDNVDATASF